MNSIKRTFTAGYTYNALVVGYIFALLSMTASLLPRAWFVQGVLTGVAFIFGYGVGNLISATYRYFELPEPPEKNKGLLKKLSLVAGLILLVFFLASSVGWNNRARELLGLDVVNALYPLRVILLGIVLAYIILVISRLMRLVIRITVRLVLKILPLKVARFTGVALGILFIIFFMNGVVLNLVMGGVNSAFALRDGTTDEGVYQPESSLRSGSEDSLVSWETLGRQGRKFTGLGPTVAEINNFSGGGAKQPIRAYVGLKSANTLEERAQLALDELIRTGAFDRDILVVATTTGTGWLDPGAMDTIEYMYNGDTAIVGLQYSYLPSWISLFVDQQVTKDTARATLNAIHGYWTQLNEQERPELYLFGLSLGAFGSQDSAQNLRLISDPVDGALWAGPPFVSRAWSALTNNRDEGSPAWRPIVDEGRVVRFTIETAVENGLEIPTAQWGDVRYAYLQHPTDPIVFFSPGLMFSEPDWLRGERGPDVSPDMDWYPGVTFWQVASDLMTAGGVPAGHGHNYSPASYIDSWAAVTRPDNWNAQKAAELKAIFSS